MPRADIGANLLAALPLPVQAPRLLLRLAGTYRWADGTDLDDNTIVWRGWPWILRDFDATGWRHDHGFLTGFDLRVRLDYDEVSFFSGLDSDTAVELYYTDALASYGSSDAVKLYDGALTGGAILDGLEWTGRVRSGAAAYPRASATPRAGFTAATAPGTYRYLSGQYVVQVRRGRQ